MLHGALDEASGARGRERSQVSVEKTFTTSELRSIANELRKDLVVTSSTKRIPHLGSCLSCVDILVALYWSELKIDPDCPDDEQRDRFIISKGHGAPALFQVLAKRGFFDLKELEQFGEPGSYFHEHPPKPGLIPGVEAATGSLGHGLPMALGMAIAGRIKSLGTRYYALVSDGECNEGSIWEAAMLASAQEVGSLTGIIDYNKWQATGRSQEIMSLEPLMSKWEAFGWHCQEVDGHKIDEIVSAFSNARDEASRPSMIIAHTVKGKGVSFMEDDNNWHYRTPNKEELAAALKELGGDQ